MTAHVPLRYRHWSYVWIPIATATMWFATLLAMLVVWLASGRPQYPSQDGSIAYISDVGASNLKPLFVVGCVITGVGFFLSLVVERFLRHSGRLMPNMRMRERVFSILAILGALLGGCGLILLSIFDTRRHPSLHRIFLLVFILGVGLSAIFSVTEYRWISKDFRDHVTLKRAYVVKGVIAFVLIVLAVVFAVTLFQAPDVGGIFEWIIAFGFTLYLITFWYDLRQSKNVEKGQLKELYGPHTTRQTHPQTTNNSEVCRSQIPSPTYQGYSQRSNNSQMYYPQTANPAYQNHDLSQIPSPSHQDYTQGSNNTQMYHSQIANPSYPQMSNNSQPYRSQILRPSPQ